MRACKKVVQEGVSQKEEKGDKEISSKNLSSQVSKKTRRRTPASQALLAALHSTGGRDLDLSDCRLSEWGRSMRKCSYAGSKEERYGETQASEASCFSSSESDHSSTPEQCSNLGLGTPTSNHSSQKKTRRRESITASESSESDSDSDTSSNNRTPFPIKGKIRGTDRPRDNSREFTPSPVYERRGRGLGKSTIEGLAEVQSRSEIQARSSESGSATNNSSIPPIEPEGQRPTAPYFLQKGKEIRTVP